MRWRLMTTHYHNDRLYEAGTEVGTGTGIEWHGRPSLNMEPVDQEAIEWLQANPNRFVKAGIPIPTELLQHPSQIMPGQRPGGQGPKLDPSQIVSLPGQGQRSAAGDAISNDMLEQRLVDKKIGGF